MKEFKTSSGIQIPMVFGKSEKAGSFPYTRGVHETMYRSRLWTMRQYAGFSTAKESNKRYQELLKNGAKGLSVAFDLPTQMGLDSDDPMALGEVGKVGVAIDTIDDMRALFDKIDLSKVSTSMTINSTAAILLCLYELVAEENGVSSNELRGTIQNDILKEYIARGTYVYPPVPSLRLITDIFKYCKENIPKWNTISISGYHIREAGSTAVQEIAFTLMNAITYVEKAIEAGLDVDEFAPRLSFFFNGHNNFLEEIAKFRAARRMWANIMKNEFGAKNEKSLKLRFHTQVAGSTLTAQQPYNNIVRVALQAMAAVLGGTQSLHTNAYDEALQLPTSESAQIALRTQQIIAHETGVSDFVDPLGGSDSIEYLTNEIERKSLDYIGTIKEQGGVLACLETGYISSEIANAAFIAQKEIEDKSSIIVGMNDFTSSTSTEIPKNKISSKHEQDQVSRLREFKKNRDFKKVEKYLTSIKEAAKDKENNLLPHIKSALKNNCSLGEISSALKEIFGSYRPKFSV